MIKENQLAKIKHHCGDCGKQMIYDKGLSIKSKQISGWWCLKCDLVEIVIRNKVHNAVTSAKRFVFYGKLGQNPKS